jgi:hypothetical protein
MLSVNNLIGFGVVGGRSQVPVTITYIDETTSSGSSTANVYTFTDNPIGTEDADRYVIIGFLARTASGTPATVVSATIGGIAATIIANAISSDGDEPSAALFMAKVPTGTTGTVVITLDRDVIHGAIGVWRVVGAPVVEAFATDTDTTVSPDAELACSIDVAPGGVCAGVAGDDGTSNGLTWVGLTEDFETHADTTAVCGGAHRTQDADGEVALAITGTWTAAPGASAMAVASFIGYTS